MEHTNALLESAQSLANILTNGSLSGISRKNMETALDAITAGLVEVAKMDTTLVVDHLKEVTSKASE
ncbi:hypothetical protein FCMLKIFP_00018 [Pseudomonas phage Ka3]|uniref:Uncharacterized protein n=1 Tax=Pseudomonas phage KPP21 TaxID=1678082 RepID=A0A0H5B152_BPK21|nr:hypothetical protein AVU12_gp111 [Pseudomonas phage KPP21]QWY17812.1 hypothetical protein [Pseudomonas phage vB_Pae-PA152]UGL60896.1 hypothetical protein [Pseudomonas phage vB_PaeS_TUMS_P6]UNI71978.1 hypothetical protein [Pseudomonas phage vB_PaeP_TUMS_P10]WQZ52368.1 hypothetical protein FCMLKIFP_00018 [Pseudomonas phage Ka3]BAR94670.1 hypothetical protein [Pseudomonas phage KPP21]